MPLCFPIARGCWELIILLGIYTLPAVELELQG